MKSLKQIIFMFLVVTSLGLSVPAQADDQKRPPKKPPVRDPREKPPKDNPPPRGEDKPKKPGASYFVK